MTDYPDTPIPNPKTDKGEDFSRFEAPHVENLVLQFVFKGGRLTLAV